MLFQSTPSAWRETKCSSSLPGRSSISIHSLRMEGDASSWIALRRKSNFNPLPPHGGRHQQLFNSQKERYFNPLPPHGGRPSWKFRKVCFWKISIHSLRMEGDRETLHVINDYILFQSTPSAWRETNTICISEIALHISIHSLRMEGDSKTAQESVFHFAYPCTILQKRMQKTTFCTRKNGFFRKKGEKFGAKPSASFCAPMIRTDTFPLNFSHRISGSSMSMVSFAPICSTFD